MSTSTLEFTSAATACESIALPEFQFCIYITIRRTLCIVVLGLLCILRSSSLRISLTECSPCEGRSLTLFTADPIEAGANYLALF